MSDRHPAYDWWAEQNTTLASMEEVMGNDSDGDLDVDPGGELLEMIEQDRVMSNVDASELITSLAGLGVPIEQAADALDMTEVEVEALAEERALTITERLDALKNDRESRL